MTAPFTIIDLCFKDFEELAEALTGWSTDFRPLTQSKRESSLQQIISPRLLFSRTRFGASIDQRGGPPEGFRSFALLESQSSEISWCHQHVDRNSLIIFPASSSFSAVSHENFDVYPFSIAESLLETMAESLYCTSWGELTHTDGKVLRCNPQYIDKLRAVLRTLFWFGKTFATDINEFNKRWKRLHIENSLVESLLACIHNSAEPSKGFSLKKKNLCLIRALDYIESCPAETITAYELSVITSVSQSTLERAFKENFSLTPKAYIKCMRLNSVHKQLYHARSNKLKINEIANQHDFWHMGQFSADYKKLFGELPSETYKR